MPNQAFALREVINAEEDSLVRMFKSVLDPNAPDIMARLEENTNAVTRLQKYSSQALIHWTKLKDI